MNTVTRRRAALLVSCLALAVSVAGIALADVDPASDVLLVQDSFVPYQPEACTQVKDALQSATRRASSAGYPLKVAVIGSARDLGAAPQFDGKPAPYAEFLGSELGTYSAHLKRNLRNVRLLVVMPAGFALWRGGPESSPALKHDAIPDNPDTNDLVRAAVTAVPKVATAAGHPVAAVKIAGGCSHKSGNALLLFGVPVLLVLLAIGLIRVLRPSREEDA